MVELECHASVCVCVCVCVCFQCAFGDGDSGQHSVLCVCWEGRPLGRRHQGALQAFQTGQTLET